MKYNIRFFLKNKPVNGHGETITCFASFTSEHLPKPGELVFIADYDIKESPELDIVPGTIYKVVYRVFIYDTETKRATKRADDMTSVEVVLRKTRR
jgi:hypothetical protein